MEKVKVFLSDPQVLFREGIHFILSGEDDFEVTGETTNNEEAYTFIAANPPNIAVLSMKDSKLNGADITRRMKRSFPSTYVILTLDKDDEDKIFLAMKSGASACLTKDIDPEELLELIGVVTQGSQPIIEALLRPGLASRALVEFEDLANLSEQVDNLLASLTAREAEVLSSIASGSGLEQLTTKLDIKDETIRRYLRSILNKLVANDQAQVLIEAAQRSMPSIIRGAVKMGGTSTEYVTKAEFNEFKESLSEQLKPVIGTRLK
jgi:two-component system NarL family response regulator